ncbi:fumarate reductase iron-sulfur subunit [Campylobacter sp. RM12327]|uniref:fumarate reductase iron-sulfur subunit n=1 Tax=Campylobacter sputorum TaxID=206 RepID=UPI000B785916|nr:MULTISPECIES: fumarate reductase iron-sulfur subunit [Campylobacter]ASM38172.1 fumarate reductase, iron-sulfur subunit [Campylobacter sputorum bv. paraureolyticus LMG 11764]ASM39798.1 fumarate reductase, iron-sulfur subunit [Campylobacter sputorum]MBE7358631.1 fumarate reductase iron-sulfur subunit [Campylobacter sp. RM11302]MBF6668811.1 fumarate reductase iron-sulfur subunit [Campylobacter sp. RM12327]MBF6673725.1 fumarate reductase iron-sulfur subunit [Campylobacter sp. RM13538]
MSRKITIKAFKYNPLSKISKPHFATYELEETSGMTLYVALNVIREKFDPDLSFDFVCRAGICGSCGMVVNGVPKLACRTLTKDYPDGVIELMPMPAFKLIKDLSVNTGEWMAAMNKRVESWIHSSKTTDISKMEEKVDPVAAQETFELDRCVECGICVASCGTAIMRKDFIGAVGLNRIARFKLDPLDERTDEDFYELVGDDNGIFGCMTLLGCEDNCPKHLPLQSKIAYMRRKLASVK